MGYIFSKFSKLGSGAKPPSPNPSPSVAEVNQIFKPTHSFWAGYATADLENMNSVKISKIYKTESSVPLEPEVDFDFRGHSYIVAQ